MQLTRQDFENLLRFRVALRRFMHWSEGQAAAAGLTPAQHVRRPVPSEPALSACNGSELEG
jgi:hypothetical protein